MKIEKLVTQTITLVFFLIAIFVAMSSAASAAKVGLVVDLGSKTYTSCVAIPDNTNAYDILQKTPLSISWSEKGQFGHALCKINGIGEDVVGTACDWGSEYWNFYISTSSMNGWSYSPVGFDTGSDCWNRDFTSYGGHYCARDGDIIGLAHGPYNTKPEYISFEQLCPNPLEITDLDVEVDGKRDKGVDENGGDFDVKPGDEVVIKARVENVLPEADDREIRDVVLIVEADDVGNEGIGEESDDTDLAPGEDDRLEVSFIVPYDAREKKYSIDLRVEGIDEDGSTITLSVPVKMRVKRDKHDIRIVSLKPGKESYRCEKTGSITAEIANIGEDDESVTVQLKSRDGGILAEENLEADYRAEHPARVTLQFPVENLAEGSNILEVVVSYSDREESSEIMMLRDKCASSGETSRASASPERKDNSPGQESSFVVIRQSYSAPVPSYSGQHNSRVSGSHPYLEAGSSDNILWTISVVALVLLGVGVLTAGLIVMGKQGKQ